jgi:predicted phage tail protein
VKYSVSGTVSTGAGTSLYLKKNGNTIKSKITTDGTFTFNNVMPGNYTITAYKLGSSFSKPAASVSVTNANVTGVSINAL